MSTQFEGKVAIVTGSSRGIGRAIAERLAEGGAAVVINYLEKETRAREVVDGITARGCKAVAIRADMSKRVDIQRLFNEAETAVGRPDIVVANAATAIIKSLVDATEDDYDRVFDTNPRVSSSSCRRPRNACATADASSSRRPAAQRCSLARPRSISAARGQWNNLCGCCRGNWGHATSR